MPVKGWMWYRVGSICHTMLMSEHCFPVQRTFHESSESLLLMHQVLFLCKAIYVSRDHFKKDFGKFHDYVLFSERSAKCKVI